MGSSPDAILLRDLLIATKDGDWGSDASGDGKLAYRVIRGADFPLVRVGDTAAVPLRYLERQSAERRTLQENDILIETAGGSNDRPTGRTLLITQRVLDFLGNSVTCASFCRFLRIDPQKIDPRYVFWFLQHTYNTGAMWEHQVRHTGIARFQYTKFASAIEVPLPTRHQQETLSEILGILEQKIELNLLTNRNLESIAFTIFKSWFVDCDPMREGLAWNSESAVLGTLVAQSKNLLNPAESPSEVFDHYSIPAFDSEKYPKLEKGEDIKSNKFLVPAGAVLLSKLNPRIPRAWMPKVSSERRSICSTEFLPLVPNEQKEDREYIYALFYSTDFLDVLVSRATGTSGSHQRVRPDDLLRINVDVPELAARKHYSDVVRPIFARVALNLEESRTLAALRDALLPKLLSGEIRAKQAEKIVGEAV